MGWKKCYIWILVFGDLWNPEEKPFWRNVVPGKGLWGFVQFLVWLKPSNPLLLYHSNTIVRLLNNGGWRRSNYFLLLIPFLTNIFMLIILADGIRIPSSICSCAGLYPHYDCVIFQIKNACSHEINNDLLNY